MPQNITNFPKNKFEWEVMKFKAGARESLEKTKKAVGKFVNDHQELCATAAIGVGTFIVKTIVKEEKAKVGRRHSNNHIYDRSEQHYWEFKRTPTPKQWKEIKVRRKKEKLSDILEDMRLI